MPDENRVAYVARALCVADGLDPEEHIYVGDRETVEVDGPTEYREKMGSAWTTYLSEARRFVTAARAMGLFDNSAD